LAWQLQEFIRRVFYTRGEVLQADCQYTSVSSLVRLALVFWLGTRQELNGIAGLNAIAWGALVAFCLGFWQSRRCWTVDSLKLSSTWRQNWIFGRWILGGTVANWVTLQLYPILAAGMISFAAAGAYQALQNLVAPVHVLLRASDTFLTPRVAKIFHKSGYQHLTRTLRLTYLIAGVPILGLLLFAVGFAEPLLRLLRGNTYLPWQQGIWIMAGFYALWYAYWPLQTAFKAIRLSRPIFIANILAIVSMLTVGLWAIHQWGVYGTMAGQALNALIINLVLWSTWWKVSRQNVAAVSGKL
jgi:O-antigen/teichoic acid export membrane protein